MKKFMNWMEVNFVPVATKVASQKHLIAIRDAFISIMPITMAGSVAVLLNVFLNTLPTSYGIEAIPKIFAPVININGVVWFGSLAILSLAFIISLGYNIASNYKVNPLAGALVAIASYVAFLPQTATVEGVEAWGLINVNYLGAQGLFPAMIIGFISTIIYSKLMQKNVIIKLPDSVPPAVNKAFASIIPGVVALYVASTLSYLILTYTGSSFHDLVNMYISKPLLGLSQGLASVVILAFLVQFFWFFGMHGHNVLAPVLEGIYQPAQLANIEHITQGGTVETLPYIWTRGSFDAYLQMGGSGITIALIIAIFLFSKKEEHKSVAKLGAPMGIFNINEPMIFGMPIVLNPLYFIPFVIIPPIAATIAYFATVLGFIPPVYIQVPWVLPPGIFAYVATGGSFTAMLVSLFNVFVAFVIWTPFVLIANKIDDK